MFKVGDRVKLKRSKDIHTIETFVKKENKCHLSSHNLNSDVRQSTIERL